LTPFAPIFVPQSLREAVSDRAWLQAMLDAERTLAGSQSIVQATPREAADAIADNCRAELFDIEELAEEGRAAGNPVEPLVRSLRERVGSDAAGYVHFGATSQDVLDTAAALVARNATGLVVAELDGAARVCARLADEHRATVMAARTLLQQAVPTTFGLKTASWLVGIVHARRRLAESRLPAQLGGAAGTLAALGDKGIDVLHAYAEALDLPEPVLPWHTRRLPLAELGATLAVAAGFCAKIALDLVLLAQTEVSEVRLPADGKSSTMPHKRNPVGPVLVRACAEHVRAAAAVLLQLEHEHERAAGAWHAEWKALSDAFAYAGGAAASLRETLEGLEVDAARMRANLRPESMSEAERFAPDAREPEDYLGSTDAFIDRALAFYHE
jgi:3-carboxy-cis,cis-muconate cycloisomerase